MKKAALAAIPLAILLSSCTAGADPQPAPTPTSNASSAAPSPSTSPAAVESEASSPSPSAAEPDPTVPLGERVNAAVGPLGFTCEGSGARVECQYDASDLTGGEPVGVLDALADDAGNVQAVLLRMTPNYDATTEEGRTKIQELADVAVEARRAVASLLPSEESELFATTRGLTMTDWGQVGVVGSEWLAEDVQQKTTLRVFASSADVPDDPELGALWKMDPPSAEAVDAAAKVEQAVETSATPADILKALTTEGNAGQVGGWTVWTVPDIGEPAWEPREGDDNWNVTWTTPDVNVMATIEGGNLIGLWMG